MQYRVLGRTGYKVSDVACGLWGMSGWSGSEDAESLAALQSAVDHGCNFFDSAWGYGNGHSDELLGRILRDNSGQALYAASKVPPLNDRWPASSEDSYEDVFPMDHVLRHVDLIREKLGTNSIDLLQLHVWTTAGPVILLFKRPSRN
jgi:aryl-alcohol dehydrogenase-like predicted oxidoreductase